MPKRKRRTQAQMAAAIKRAEAKKATVGFSEPKRFAPKKIDADAAIIAQARDRRRAKEEKRKELGALPGQKLVAEKRKGYVRRFVNGSPERLDTVFDKGYSLVSNSDTDGVLTTDLGSAHSQIVGKNAAGGARRDYLVEIPEELYREGQKSKEKAVRTQASAVSRNERDARKLATPAGRAEIYEKPV